MKRLPLIPTIVVAAAVATMIALGIWQVRRAAWKERLLADYAHAAGLPAVDLDPLLDGHTPLPPLSFRRVLVTCHARGAEPEVRAGRSAADVPGQAYFIPCRPGEGGLAGRIRVNAGWADRPDAARRLALDGIVAGHLGVVDKEEGPIALTAATPAPPLAPSQPPRIETIPNNHRLYAAQWFFFALAAALIYALALRRRDARKLPPEP